jgi:hypothetical protein
MDSWSVDATPGSNLAHENAHGIYLLSGPVSLCSSKITAKYFKKTFQKTKAACPKNGKGWHSMSCENILKFMEPSNILSTSSP